ncbi:MAG: Unknown, probable insecticidal toxin [uncultured Paraburkholderia sp.]|nr:MAG: Unknown, probable insecticidal toxin [uncultured Paraburkholderia sp.]
MDLAISASVLSTTATASYTVAAGLDAVPKIYGMAFGGSRYGSIARAVGTGIEIGAAASRTAAERLSQSEAYRRRRQEWEIQRNAAQSDVNQIDAQLASLAVRREGAVLQKTYLETQQNQTQAQMSFLQNKFTSKALYNWLRGKLAAVYYQYYDLPCPAA